MPQRLSFTQWILRLVTVAKVTFFLACLTIFHCVFMFMLVFCVSAIILLSLLIFLK